MKEICAFLLPLLALAAPAIQPPAGVVKRAGDLSVVLHWDQNLESNLAGYRVYRSTSPSGPFNSVTPSLLTTPGFCDLNVANGAAYYYYVTCVDSAAQPSVPSITNSATPQAFATDADFLEFLQQVTFDYFWYTANPMNGLIPDRAPSPSASSIAAVGFGLTAIGVAIDHGWVTRAQGAARVRAALGTLANAPQGPAAAGTSGYKGWFYHFLDLNTGLRAWNSELSSIDTALLLAGVLYAREYFDGSNAEETDIRARANLLFNRVDWNWMMRGSNVLCMGWQPESGFLSHNWVGYNEAMILYLLGLGAANDPLPASSWAAWTNGYTWDTYYGQTFASFPPLFGHQYSHCWIDFRHTADDYMNSRNSTYFENSRRATIAQRAYCIANPLKRVGYSENVWGLSASDGPFGYAARGAPPAQNDDGTIAPTAAGGSIAFAPEICLPTLRYFYRQFRRAIWTSYGFRDAFNQGQQWWGPDHIGIDQGPILIMIENHRNGRVWKKFMQAPEARRGLQRAGFVPLSFMSPSVDPQAAQNAMNLTWPAPAGHVYQVEYSPDLASWSYSPTGRIIASGPTATWTDDGPPATDTPPFNVSQRFYRVFQFGAP